MAEDEPAEQEPNEPSRRGGRRARRGASRPAEEPSAAEHEAIAPPAGSHTTEERHAIADQPTEMFDVEEEFAPTEAPAPPDEDLVAEEIERGPPRPGRAGRAAGRSPRPTRTRTTTSSTSSASPTSSTRRSRRRSTASPSRSPTSTRRSSRLQSAHEAVPSRPTSTRRPRREARRRRGRARGDAGLPRGGTRGRPALVRAEAPQGLRLRRLRQWSQPGSNRRPRACKARALPTELWPRQADCRSGCAPAITRRGIAAAGSDRRGSWSGPAGRRRRTRSRARRRPAPGPRTRPGASSGRRADDSRSAAGTGPR